MNRRLAALSILPLLLALDAGATDLDRLSRDVLFADEPASRAAAAELREAGPDGMIHLLEAFDRSPGADPQRLDRVCGARDCAASRLYWYTDLDQALAAAKASGKPVLSLRLLGRLDEELSCANSRFFRSTLYPNREVSAYLRENFILHWRSVSPVPVVRIDFGNGRTLERPLTGNSIHYVLDPEGRLVDALPGLYGSQIFLRVLREAARDIAGTRELTDDQFQSWARSRSARLVGELAAGYRNDLVRLASFGQPPTPPPPPPPATSGSDRPATEREKIPTARDPWAILQRIPGVQVDRINVGGNETGAKQATETSLLRALSEPPARSGRWDQLAVLYLEDARLDAASRDLVLRKEGVDDPGQAEALIRAFERDIALDTALNQYGNRLEIHRRLASRQRPIDFEAFNAEVYAEIFETPTDDPWMGLAPASAYAALPRGGRG